jgi:hypothetical protein
VPLVPVFRTWRRIFAVALVVGVISSAVIVRVYGRESLFPALVGNFVASLLAFTVALAWERDRERRQLEQSAAEIEDRRATEIKRRLAPVRSELEENAEQIASLAGLDQGAFRVVHPQLLEGAWTANAPQLFELVADYDLTSDLATTYGPNRGAALALPSRRSATPRLVGDAPARGETPRRGGRPA